MHSLWLYCLSHSAVYGSTASFPQCTVYGSTASPTMHSLWLYCLFPTMHSLWLYASFSQCTVYGSTAFPTVHKQSLSEPDTKANTQLNTVRKTKSHLLPMKGKHLNHKVMESNSEICTQNVHARKLRAILFL